MGCVAGVMCCDYYLIKQRKLDVRELYRDRGIYYYRFGINWRAFAAFFIGFVPLVPGFAKTIGNNLNVGGAWKIYTFAFLYGFMVCGLSYYVICTYISDIGVAKVDVAVYPPKVGDVAADIETGKAEVYKEKSLDVSETEVSPSPS